MKTGINSEMNVPVPRIRNRAVAGGILADRMLEWTGRADALVLGIPRGGVPVAAALASALRLPFDVLVVQRIRLPQHDAWQQDQRVGAISRGGIQFLYTGLIASQHPLSEDVALAIETARVELARKESAYRNACPIPDLSGRTAILVDDGIVTGATMRVAMAAARLQNPARIVIAVPFATISALQGLQSEADATECLSILPESAPVHSLYDESSDLAEEDVRMLVETGQQEWMRWGQLPQAV